MLVRALTADPEILVLVEPTSAVDAHTEARIAARLRQHRAGRTTVVTSTSPLMLDAVDEVVLLIDGRVVATGSHGDLLRDERRLPVRRDSRDRAQPSEVAPMSATTLPVADGRAMRGYVRTLARRHPRLLGGCGAAPRPRRGSRRWPRPGCSATWSRPSRAAPRRPTSTGSSPLLAGFLVLQTVLTRYARYVSQVLGEQVLAELREDFVGNALALPVGVVESAGSGDLLTRTSRDVEQLGWSVRWALPEWTIAVVTAVLTFAAALSVGWWVALPCAAGRPAAGDRAAVVPRPRQGRLPARECVVLRHQRDAHRDRRGRPHASRRSASGKERIEAIDRDIKESYDAERYTLYLRTVFFPSMEISYLLPTVCTLAVRRLPLHPGPGRRSATSRRPRSTCRC